MRLVIAKQILLICGKEDMAQIVVLLLLGVVIGYPAAVVWASDRKPSIHPGALLIGGLHCLGSLMIGLFGIGGAWASAATGDSGPGIIGYFLAALQLPLLILPKLIPDVSLSTAAICLVPSSLLYGYAIAGLARWFGSLRKAPSTANSAPDA